MTKPSAPCRNCEDRYIGCHCECQAYKDYCTENAELNNIINSAKETEAVLRGYTNHKIKKLKGFQK